MTNALMLSIAMLTASPETPQAAAVRWALSEIESGSDDRAVGKAGEVSRYQIMPKLWSTFCGLHGQPKDEEVAWDTALNILWICRERAGSKLPDFVTPAQLYALWHRPSRYAKGGYRISALTRREQDRCRRFANLYAKRLKEITE